MFGLGLTFPPSPALLGGASKSPILMASATRLHGMWGSVTAPASKNFQCSHLVFGTPDYPIKNPRFFFPGFVDASGTESAAPNAYVVDGLSILVGSTWTAGAGFTVDPAVDAVGYLAPALNCGTIPANSICAVRTAFHVNIGQKFLNGYFGQTQNGEAQDGAASSLAAKLTDGSAMSNNSGLSALGGQFFGPAFMVAEGWDGRRVYGVIGDSQALYNDDSWLLATSRGVVDWIGRGLDDNASSLRHPYMQVSNSGDSMGVMMVESGWSRRIKQFTQKCPNIPWTHTLSANGHNDVLLSDYRTVFMPKATSYLTLLRTKFGKPIIQTELPPRAQSTANAFADLAGQSYASDKDLYMVGDRDTFYAAKPNACRWQFNLDVGTNGAADPLTFYRANGYIDDSFALWPALSYDTGSNRGFWALRTFSALLTSQYNGASATTFLMDTAPTVGEEIVVNPTNANRLYAKVISVTGSGPYTVTVEAGNSTTYAVGVSVKAALPSSNGAVHFGPMAHQLAMAQVIAFKNARPST